MPSISVVEIRSGIGEDDVCVCEMEIAADAVSIEPARIQASSRQTRAWARAHLCLDYPLTEGIHHEIVRRDGYVLYQGHTHSPSRAASGSYDDAIQPAWIWLDARALERFRDSALHGHSFLLFDALMRQPFAPTGELLIACACAARDLLERPLAAHIPGNTLVVLRPRPRTWGLRSASSAICQSAVALLLVFGGRQPHTSQVAGPSIVWPAKDERPVVASHTIEWSGEERFDANSTND